MAKDECLQQCNTLCLAEPAPEQAGGGGTVDLSAEVLARRQELIDYCVQLGLDVTCQGPRPGLMHLVCGMSNDAKTAIDRRKGRRPDLIPRSAL